MPPSGCVLWEQGIGQRNQEERNGRWGPSSILSSRMPALYQLQRERKPWTLPSETVLLLGKHGIHHPREKGRLSQDHRGPPQLSLDPGNGSSFLEHCVRAMFLWHSDNGLDLSEQAVTSGAIINNVVWIWGSLLAAWKDHCVPGRGGCSELSGSESPCLCP